ncbi:MAG TPA: phosphate ABC transporter substrate-binding protein PstS [Chloroflexota bacterium]|nr:phosphate ABC transporter substrate-binding protein PstS [Chloroflexota bacterium]
MIQRRQAWHRLRATGYGLLASVLIAGTVSPAWAATHTRAATVSLVGAGSTFDLPFFKAAFKAYAGSHHVSVNYQGIGSGGGIQQFTANTIDFGATDVPMNAAELEAATRTGGAVVQIPVALGGVAIAYNLPGVGRGQLRLDSATLAQIFMGKISTWNNAAITRLNPALKLPNLSILPVHRSESSGTTYITTDYLTSVSSEWAKTLGEGKIVSWPTGLGGKGNPGVAAAIKQHPGAIGYVELAYALANNIPYMTLKNKAGAYVPPTQVTVRAAAAQFPHVSSKTFAIVNAPGRTSYPIAGYSWVLLRQHPRRNGAALVQLFHWTVTSGQSYAAQVNYVALPTAVQMQALQALNGIK